MTSEIEAFFERYGPSYKWFATITVMIGTLSMVLAATIVNVAIPNIMGAFGITQNQAQWLATGYFAAVSAMMLVNSWALETYGPRTTYLGATTLFMLASVLGGLAPNESVLIFARVVQGGMAGITQPLAMIIIFHVFPRSDRGKGMGIFGLGVILAPALGPAIGGMLVDLFSWRAVFFLALPLSVLGLAMGLMFLPARPPRVERQGFDWLGFSLLTTAMTSVMWGIASGQRLGWTSSQLLAVIGLGIVSSAGFILWQLRSPRPLLNMQPYRSTGFACGSALAFVLGFALFGTTYLIPLFVQQIQNFTPTAAGIIMMPAGLIMAMLFPFTGRLSDLVTVDKPIMAGLLIVAISCFAMIGADVHTSFWRLALWILLGRIGLALLMPSINAGALRSLELEMVPQGSGPLNFARQLGGAFGVSLSSLVLDWRTESHAAYLAEGVVSTSVGVQTLLHQLQAAFARGGVPADTALPASLEFLGKMIAIQGSTQAFHDAFATLGAAFIIALLPAWLMGRAVQSP